MNEKSELALLRKIISKATKTMGIEKGNTETLISLDDKVDAFIRWYYDNMVNGKYTDIGEYNLPKRMRDLIEKMAVWYELRYPAYEINRLMYCCGQETISINDIMFKNNPYTNVMLGENSEYNELDWDEFYNTNVFMKALPWEERCYFAKSKYKNIVYLNPNSRSAHLHLTKNGVVEAADYVSIWADGMIKDEELIGLHLRKVIELFNERGIKLPINNELEKEVKSVDNWNYQKEGILDCVMYRIIERGGNRIGPRRAFIFAKEFGRNIDIPMMYAVDCSDPGLRSFINEYIKAGGCKDLECYVGYFSRASKNEKLNTVSIQTLILTQANDAATFYTPEEDELHQKFVNMIASQVNQDVVKHEDIKRLRLERKLEKSKKN